MAACCPAHCIVAAYVDGRDAHALRHERTDPHPSPARLSLTGAWHVAELSHTCATMCDAVGDTSGACGAGASESGVEGGIALPQTADEIDTHRELAPGGVESTLQLRTNYSPITHQSPT